MKKLTDDQVSEIREQHDKYLKLKREADQLSIASLAKKFEVGDWAIMRAIAQDFSGARITTLTEDDLALLKLACAERDRLMEEAKPCHPKQIAERLGLHLDYVRKLVAGLERASI